MKKVIFITLFYIALVLAYYKLVDIYNGKIAQFGDFLLFYCPVILLLSLVLITKKYLKDISTLNKLIIYAIPGVIVAIIYGYGFYSMEDFRIDGFFGIVFIFVPVFVIVSSIIGILIDFIWSKLTRKKQIHSSKDNE